MKTILVIALVLAALYILWELIVTIRVYHWKNDPVRSRLSRVLGGGCLADGPFQILERF